MSRENFGNKLKNLWQKYEYKIVLVSGFLIVGIISYEAGMLNGQKWQKAPMIIEKTAIAETSNINVQKVPEAPKLASDGQNEGNRANIPADCALVGSKNSNKYHLPNCRWAKQIKPENITCFKSAEDAVQKGYQPDKNCIQ